MQPIAVRLEVTPGQAFRLALVENVQRDSLLPLEEACGYERLLRDQSISQSELARQLGVDRRRLSEKLSLLRLPDAVQQLVSARADTFGERHALILASAPAGVDVTALAQRCAGGGWSLLQLRSAVEKRAPEPGPKLFENLQLALNRRGGFTLTVRARSRDEVERTIADLERTLYSLRRTFAISSDTREATGPNVVRTCGQPDEDEAMAD